MSDSNAIATVTATLQRTLQEAVQTDVSGARVTTVRPAEGENTNLPSTGVNVFLYQISQNPSWRNSDLPTRRANGELMRLPTAAVDLHYLFSFYGGDVVLEPQRLLGSTVAFLHSQPLLTRAQVADAVSGTDFLTGSDLAEQIDLVRFVPLSLSLEELSRLWSVFFQIKYVLSIAFKASVVLIEPSVTTKPAPPPRTVNLTAQPLSRVVIQRVRAEAGEGETIFASSVVRIDGERLYADLMQVEVDGQAVAALQEARADHVTFALPAGLLAGAHSVQVRHGVEIGTGDAAHLVFGSNIATFVLQPRIAETAGNPDVDVADVHGSGAAPRSATVTVGVDPQVGTRQLITLELLTAAGVAHTFVALPRTAAAARVAFAIDGVAPSDYLVRVRVDGAESPLDTDANGQPIGPKVTIP
jgi:Pvc16 N-terminal domain